MTLPSFGRESANSMRPRILHSARKLSATASRKASSRMDASTCRVAVSRLFSEPTTSRSRAISAWRASTRFTCSGRMNMPRTFAVWSARPIQPLMRVFVRPQELCPASTADMSPVAKRKSG